MKLVENGATLVINDVGDSARPNKPSLKLKT